MKKTQLGGIETTIKRIVSFALSTFVAVATLMAVPTMLSAQDNGPARAAVRIVNVKTGHQADFAAAILEVSDAARDAGRPYFHVYQRVRGGDLPAFTIFAPDEAYGDLPEMEVPPSVIDRLQNANNGSTLLSLAFSGGISTGTVEPAAPNMRVRVRTVRPGSADDYLNWQSNELMPLLRDAGVPDVRLGRITLGGNTNTFVRLTYSEGIAGDGAGGPIDQRALGRVLEREASMLVNAEDIVYVYRRDLSFTAD